jgi:imidazole glycerol-phosphate synthase subunit HisH
MTIAVLDYGLGNFGSIIRMIEKAGGKAVRISTPKELQYAEKIILPGVGNFDRGMRQILEREFMGPLRERVVEQHIPIMGICLGMQMLCASSEEGSLPGLGYVNADVRKFQTCPEKKLKIPHMGWNTVCVTRKNSLMDVACTEEQRFYFVHSYHVVPNDPKLTIATTTHGVEFCSAFQSDNIFGLQFHPEKSHRFGMALMKHFVNI